MEQTNNKGRSVRALNPPLIFEPPIKARINTTINIRPINTNPRTDMNFVHFLVSAR
jgi:hypothetical protein